MIDWSKERTDLTATYRKIFQNDLPKLDADFTDEETCDFLLECLKWRIIAGKINHKAATIQPNSKRQSQAQRSARRCQR